MNEFLKMDIFFVVATIGLVVLIVLLAIALFYLIQLVKTLNRVADTVETEALALKDDLDAARASVKKGSLGLLSLIGFAGKASKRLLSKKRRGS